MCLLSHRVAASFLLIATGMGRADEPSADSDPDTAPSPVREWMQEYAEATTVWIDPIDNEVADLVPQPVFRYADQPRNIPDATLWVWTKDGRPVAFQKLEVDARPGFSQWTVC